MPELIVPKKYDQPLPTRYSFQPQTDITAFELAMICPFLVRPIYAKDMERIGTAARHLVLVSGEAPPLIK